MKNKILELLGNQEVPLYPMDIYNELKLTTVDELNTLNNLLNQLEGDFTLQKTNKGKYRLMSKCSEYAAGKLDVKASGNGYLLLPGDDLFVHQKNMNGAINGDRVLVEKVKYNNQYEGKVLKIAKRVDNVLAGVITKKNGDFYLQPLDKKNTLIIEIDKKDKERIIEGSIVNVKINKESKNHLTGEVVSLLGHITDPKSDILLIAAENNRHTIFPDEVLEEASLMPIEINPNDKKGRKDLTNEMIFTIDGDDTKDIDDAISLSFENDLYKLGVHIADVSHYVKEKSPLDKEAFERGCSSYLADTVIPMLPRELSNGICSLNEGVERLAMSVDIYIDINGRVKSSEIYPSVIKSNKKMTYKKVNDIIMRNIVATDYKPFENKIRLMHKLSKIIRNDRYNKGSQDFELDEAKIIQDENGVAVDVIKRCREDGEKLIEDFMIAANEAIATTIYNMNLPFIYRCHDIPSEEKMESFINLLKVFNYNVDMKINSSKPKNVQRLQEKVKVLCDQENNINKYKVLSSLLLRSMKKANYMNTNIGHYGLALENYSHFTSPIRRYSDLWVHRLLKRYLVDNNFSDLDNLNNDLFEIAGQCSDTEVSAVSAERDCDDMKFAEYMESHIGETAKGIITSVTNYGMYIELENCVEGLVRISSIKGDYFNYVEELLSLVGKSTKKTYTLGDEVLVKVIGASKAERTIDFEIVVLPELAKEEGTEEDGNKK